MPNTDKAKMVRIKTMLRLLKTLNTGLVWDELSVNKPSNLKGFIQFLDKYCPKHFLRLLP